MKLSTKQMVDLYWRMVTIRLFEEKIVTMYARGLVSGLAHLYVGEEAVATGVCAHLSKEDCITSTQRGHGRKVGREG